jgi:uncharacterized repeat protein (TIGR04076 family)
MKRWYQEDWRFRISVLQVGNRDRAKDCRLGFEPGDTFECSYECPTGFCPKTLLKVFPLMEAVRSGGDLRNLGGSGPAEMEIICPDGVVRLRLMGEMTTPSDR